MAESNGSRCSRSVSVVEPPTGGSVAPGWEAVRDVFVTNFQPTDRDPGDLGAGLCVIKGGDVVVDLSGGWRDRAMTEPFTADTLVNSYSVGKGISAAIALAAVSAGLIELDAPARTYWTELSLDTTLRQHLSHQVGLPALRGDVDPDLPLHWDRMCAALADTEPWWTPGTAHGYHANTAGFLVGEPIRRAAVAARFGDLLQEWFAQPFGADLYFGVPTADLARCSEMGFAGDTFGPPPGPTEFPDEYARMRHHTYFNPRTLSGMGIVETTRWREAEVPSTNLHATAAGVARVYSALLDPAGPVDAAVLAEARTAQVDGDDLILEKRSRFGLGFQLHQDDRPIGVSPSSFGHYGFGGSLGFADPDADIAVAYIINRPGDRWQMPRTKRLLAALRGVVRPDD
jgi:CubicO group peptidase (beta-lactamase class C family)